ncbi:MAG: DUF4011 domain-containing protein, partial [Planctomycetota bacterium]|nr:DUF4011 domain-containing protein [Planctomycetota bacterium]
MADPVPGQLGKARDRLLDLTLNNRMLNYRPPKRVSVRVVDERIEQVWRTFVDDEDEMAFLAREEHDHFDKQAGTFPGDELEDDGNGETFALPGLFEEPRVQSGAAAATAK